MKNYVAVAGALSVLMTGGLLAQQTGGGLATPTCPPGAFIAGTIPDAN